ncbi:MAG: hypothetical protein M0D53_05815 [Flavobacterium sp. JAD_PAG50586_2]|nr:MAG: hypothetical protein M0D53_05815 [Flavobacterium sp. JAD_PAG50586_2]
MKIRILFIALLFSAFSWGQVNIAAFGTNYTQDFNTLTTSAPPITWTDNSTLPGWYARTDATSPIGTNYGANNGSVNTGGLYSFGTTAAADRALGMASSNTFTGPTPGVNKGYYGWRLRNTTGAAITSLTITWTGEQWRADNTNAQTLSLFYQIGTTVTNLTGGTWTSASSVFTTPNNTTILQIDGNVGGNRSVGISTTISISLAAGDEIMLRWEDLNDAGNDHGLGIDDVTVVANGLYTAVDNGDWNTPATWDKNAVPPASANVLIPSPYTVYLNGTTSTTTRNTGTTTTVDVGGTLSTANVGVANTNSYVNNGTTTINGTFRLEGNSTASGNNFVYGATTGTLNFSNTAAKTVVNTDVFWPAGVGFRPYNVNVLNGGINMSSGGTAAPRTVNGTFSTANKGATTGVTTVAASVLTLNGTIRIDANGQFATAASAPIYGSSSTLIYNSGGTFLRFREWDAAGAGTIGTTQGYPNNVQISNGTTLDFSGAGISRACAGNFTIDAGCTYTMPAATTGDLIVRGNLINNGSLFLSNIGTTGGI